MRVAGRRGPQSRETVGVGHARSRRPREGPRRCARADRASSSARARSCAWATTTRAPIEVIPTGSIALDVALGIGGLPRGRVVEIYGPESLGQDDRRPARGGQRAEGRRHRRVHRRRARARPGVRRRSSASTPTRCSSRQPDTGEQALEIADMLIRSGAIDIIVIDSVAALVPRAEIEGEMGDSHVGLQARLMSQALRKMTGALSNTDTTAIFINQLREKIGVMFGSPGDHHRWQGAEVLRLGPARRPSHRDAQGRHRRGRQPHPRQGRQEQDGPAVQAGRVRHPLRPRHLPRGRPDRHGRRARLRPQVRRLVHLRRRPARPGQGERAQRSCATTPTSPTRSRRRSRRSSASAPQVDEPADGAVRRRAGRLLSLMARRADTRDR